MTCDILDDLLEEYVDGSLSPDERSAADKHLAGCVACAEASRRRRQIGGRLESALQRATESLQLEPRVERRILREWAANSGTTAVREPSGWFTVAMLWRWAAAGAIGVAVVWVGASFLLQPIGPNAASPESRDVVIEVSYRAPAPFSHKDGEYVQDRIDFDTVTVNTRLQ